MKERAPALLLLLALLAATGIATAYAAHWPSDNRPVSWLRGAGSKPAYRVLEEEFHGDESVLLRADRFTTDSQEALDWLAALGPRLRDLPGVAALADSFHLPGSAPPNPAQALAAAAARPGSRALDLVALQPPRADFLLTLDGTSGAAQISALARTLQRLPEEAAAHGLRLRAAGHPLIAAALDAESARVERVFAPLLALVALLAVALALRSWIAAGLVLLPAVLATSLTRATLRALDWPSNMVLVSAGPLVLVIVLASAMHLVGAWLSRRRDGASAAAAAAAARREKLAAGLLAALTTSCGFGVFLFSDLEPVRRLGIAVGVAVLLAIPLLYGSLPILLAGLGGAVRVRPPRRFDRAFWSSLAAFAVARRRPILLLAGALGVGCVLAALHLPVGTDALQFFPHGDPVRESFLSIESEGAGLSTLEILAERTDGRPWTPAQLTERPLEDSLRAIPGLVGVFGPQAVARDVRAVAGVAAPVVLPGALREAQRLSADGHWARWTARFHNGSAAAAESLKQGVRSAAQEWGRTRHARVLLTGTLMLLLWMQAQLVGTLGTSLLLTVLVTGLLFLFVARRPRVLLAAMLTNLFPVATTLGVAWLVGWNLDGATVMVAAVVLGLAVDNTFHILHAQRLGGGSRSSLFRAYARVGEAATVSSLALALGFSVLALSGFEPTARFGLLAAAGAGSALLADLLLLPALLPLQRTAPQIVEG